MVLGTVLVENLVDHMDVPEVAVVQLDIQRRILLLQVGTVVRDKFVFVFGVQVGLDTVRVLQGRHFLFRQVTNVSKKREIFFIIIFLKIFLVFQYF
jgi:hypothetical protein